MTTRWPPSFDVILGMLLLVASLVIKRTGANIVFGDLGPLIISLDTLVSWSGSLLVVIGTGRILFLDEK
jgi:hypothetical protein